MPKKKKKMRIYEENSNLTFFAIFELLERNLRIYEKFMVKLKNRKFCYFHFNQIDL